MHFYPAAPSAVTCCAAEEEGLAPLGTGGLDAGRETDLAGPARPGGDGRSALVAAGGGEGSGRADGSVGA